MAHLGNTIINGALRVIGGENVDTINGVTVGSSPKFTDASVSASSNHYTPATASGQDKSASASGATAAWGIDVVKGVTLNTDGKGHVTGISVTSGKIPNNPDTDTKVTQTATTTNANYEVLFSATADNTTRTETTGKTTTLRFNPNKGALMEGNATVASGENSHAEGYMTTASGSNSHAEGFKTFAVSDHSHAEGCLTTTTVKYAHAEGGYTIASGEAAHAEGLYASAAGSNSHSEGYQTKASGKSSHAEGNGTTASGEGAHAEGNSTLASAENSHAEGSNTVARNRWSHAEGYATTASGIFSHAEGQQTNATTDGTHAEGNGTTASGYNAHAEGSFTRASANGAHAEGSNTVSTGTNSHAEGYMTTASGNYSHAEGQQTSTNSSSAHAEGYKTTASGNYSHAEGQSTRASAVASHAEGYYTTASSDYSHSEGYKTSASGKGAHSEGGYTTASSGGGTIASGENSHSEGYGTKASGAASHAEGYQTIASGTYSHTEGYQAWTSPTAYGAHAEGGYPASGTDGGTTANGVNAHAEGFKTVANGASAHAEGNYTTAGSSGHAEGRYTQAGTGAHAEGYYSSALGENSHASGSGTCAAGTNQTVIGKYNVADSTDLLIIGNGSDDASRSNALNIGVNAVIYPKNGIQYPATRSGALPNNWISCGGGYSTSSGKQGLKLLTCEQSDCYSGFGQDCGGGPWELSIVAGATNDNIASNGQIRFLKHGNSGTSLSTYTQLARLAPDGKFMCASVVPGGSDYAEFFEWNDANPNEEDRIGYFVTFDDENKIRIANTNDEYILGVTSANPCVLGNGDKIDANEMCLKDEFGRLIYEEVPEMEVISGGSSIPKLDKNGNIIYIKQPKLNPDYKPSKPDESRFDKPEWCPVGMLGVLITRDDGTCEVNDYATVSENGVATKALTNSVNKYRVIKRKSENIVEILFR